MKVVQLIKQVGTIKEGTKGYLNKKGDKVYFRPIDDFEFENVTQIYTGDYHNV